MSHNLEQINSVASSALTIANHRPANARKTKRHDAAVREVRITKLGPEGLSGSKGIRVKTRRFSETGVRTAQLFVDITGEDLFALREFLAELPEEAFVQPAPTYEKLDRWNDGDIVEEFFGADNRLRRIWVRRRGAWDALGCIGRLPDSTFERRLGDQDDNGWYVEIVRQASGQDL